LANPILRKKLDAKEFLVVPGVQDMIAAVMTKKVGFDIVYGSGYWLTASCLGLPDAGLATYTQMVDRMRTVAQTTGAALIADADTGYGGLLNVHHTVRGYEAAGGSFDLDRFRWWKVMGTLAWGVGLAGQAAAHLDGTVRDIVMAASGRRVSEIEWDLLMQIRPAARA